MIREGKISVVLGDEQSLNVACVVLIRKIQNELQRRVSLSCHKPRAMQQQAQGPRQSHQNETRTVQSPPRSRSVSDAGLAQSPIATFRHELRIPHSRQTPSQMHPNSGAGYYCVSRADAMSEIEREIGSAPLVPTTVSF